MNELGREQQCPSAQVELLTIILTPAYLAGLHGNDGAVGGIEHLHAVGKVLGETALDKEPVNTVTVQAGVYGRHLVIMYDTYQRMQYRSVHISAVNIRI